jgi:hypothetical protein
MEHGIIHDLKHKFVSAWNMVNWLYVSIFALVARMEYGNLYRTIPVSLVFY